MNPDDRRAYRQAGRQAGLFAEADPFVQTCARAAAAVVQLPPQVRLGTSSWTFAGWGGLVYGGRPSEARLRRDGLGEYARFSLFRTVGIDRSFYEPLSRETVDEYAGQLAHAPDLAALVKAPSAVTTYADRGGLLPTFLYADLMLRTLEPLRGSAGTWASCCWNSRRSAGRTT